MPSATAEPDTDPTRIHQDLEFLKVLRNMFPPFASVGCCSWDWTQLQLTNRESCIEECVLGAGSQQTEKWEPGKEQTEAKGQRERDGGSGKSRQG